MYLYVTAKFLLHTYPPRVQCCAAPVEVLNFWCPTVYSAKSATLTAASFVSGKQLIAAPFSCSVHSYSATNRAGHGEKSALKQEKGAEDTARRQGAM